ncbi:MAG: response regulator [Acidobacteriota bacterium]
MNIADLQVAGGPTGLPEHYQMSVDLSYEALASKKPPAKSMSSRKRKGKETDNKGRGTVLVVDDVPDVTEMIELLLKHAGYDVSTAKSAQDALHLARLNHYDLVISDIGMPDMNGYELAEALRELAAYNKTPLIAVTGYSEYDDRGRAVRAGFNVHLTKPIEPTQLLTLIRELLAQFEPGATH